MSNFIAHISDDNRIQTVKEHCENTADLCSNYASIIGMPSMGRLAGLLHDAGKLCSDFNNYIQKKNNFTRGEIDHAYAGARYIWEKTINMPIWHKEAARLIAHVIISHHGIHDWIDIEQHDYFKKRIANEERWCEIKANTTNLLPENTLQTLLNQSADELKNVYKNIETMTADTTNKAKFRAFYTGMVERFLQSCLIDADRTDTENFMNGTVPPEPNIPAVWESMHHNMENKLTGFSDKRDTISALRQNISDRCAAFADHRVGTVQLIVPTGGGKTLSSLRFAIEYCRKFGMKKILYTAPYMSILEQNSKDFHQIAGDENFLEHHSNVITHIDDDEELKKYELSCIHWTDPVIATTMVQFLNTLFSRRIDAVRRFHRLDSAVMIIDEIQSLPLKCVYLFDLAVNFLTKFANGTIILCSATQPQLDSTKFPVILDERSSMTGDFSKDFETFHRTHAVPLLKNGGYSFDEAAEICIEKFHDNGNLLLIVNTKRSAIEMFNRLSNIDSVKEHTTIIHISTRLCPAHRKHEIDRMKKLLNEGKPIICVTTQIIEAGVDISFNCVIRALAGLDNAAQAAGRCNRNGESKCRDVYIIELNEEKLSRLPEISKACDCSKSICGQCGFDDVISPEAAAEYFKRYYSEMENTLSYKHNDAYIDSDLLDMLSLNKNRGNHNPTLYTGQAFKTAGEIFEVIDNNTQSVIVPYNDDARKIITALNGNMYSPAEFAKLQRKAQQYIVGVYPNELRELSDNGAVYELKSGALALNDGWYNQSMGIVSKGSQETYIF